MPNSLRSKLSKLRYKRQISDEEYRELIEKLNGHNKELLDKIRAEITDLADADAYGDYQQGFNFGLMKSAQIIDKYKAESEVQE